MTVSSETKRNAYIATSSQTVFPYDFRIIDESHLDVYQNGTLLTLSTHYTVSGVGATAGGNVTLVTGATANDTVTILRSVPQTQLTDYVENDAFPAQTHEDALDLLVMSAQELSERMDRAVIMSPSSTYTDLTMPAPVSGRFIKWKSDLSGFENATGAGSGNVVGPTTSIDNTVPRIDGTDGDAIQGSPFTIEDTGEGVLTSSLASTGTPAGLRIDCTATSGDSGTVPNGLYVTGDVTDGSFSHMNVILGWSPSQTVKGTYQGVEGRVDLSLAGSGAIGVGVLGRASGDNASSNAGSIAIGVDAQAIKGDSGDSGTGTYYGLRAFATDGDVGRGIYAYAKGNTTLNINAEFGDGTTSGDNGVVSFKGYITDGGGVASAHMQVNDTVDQLLFNLTDAKLDGAAFWLRDGAGASKVSVLDNSVTEVASIDSDGNLELASGAEFTYRGAVLKPQVKSGTFTRATSTATGTQAITGVGFKPVYIYFMYDDSGAAWEGGYGWTTGASENYGCQNTTIQVTAAYCVYYNAAFGGSNIYTAVLSSFDSDGFTLSWTKTGSPTATLNVRWFAIGEW